MIKTYLSVLLLSCFLCIRDASAVSAVVPNKSYADFVSRDVSFDIMDFLGMKKFTTFQVEQNAKRKLVIADYSNPNDKYEPTTNVQNGHKLSGLDFDTTQEYLGTVLMSPVALCVTGFVSIFLLNLMLCCRSCFKCLRCDPNDHHTGTGHSHDSNEKRVAYINHQKLMIFIIEMVLCFCVMLADMLCYYGYGFIVSGGKDLLDALDMIQEILGGGVSGALKIVTSAKNMQTSIDLAKTSTCPSSNAQDAPTQNTVDAGYLALETATTAVITAMSTVQTLLGELLEYVDDGKKYIKDYLLAYADVFVFLVWSFAFISVVLFVLFRFCRSEFGTKIAILWGELTFIILLLVCLPFMIFSSMMGDFCMNPSYSAVINSPEAIRGKIQYYATCTGVSDIEISFADGKTQSDAIATEITNTFQPYCSNSVNGNSMTDISAAAANSQGIGVGILTILNAASCSKIQAVWFKIMNEALCTNFYSGIYSLWVSQFITSFFLFFLIVVASVSYHYFKKSSVYITPNTEDDNKKVHNSKPIYDQMDNEIEMAPISKTVHASAPLEDDINDGEPGLV